MNGIVNVGDRVRVVSGPHEGRGGEVTYIKAAPVGTGEPEDFAIVRYEDARVEGGVDEIAVPVRRLARG